MDLSTLSDADLQALQTGDMTGVSEAGLRALAGGPPVSNSEQFVRGLKNPIDAGTQLGAQVNAFLAGKGLVPKLAGDPAGDIAREKQIFEARPGGSDFSGYRMAGELLSPANLALMAIPGATIPRMMMLGAGSGLLQPSDKTDATDFALDKAKQAGTGAVGAGALSVLGRTLARLFSPKASLNPDLSKLRDEGVNPTVGQALGGRLDQLEEKLQSLPLMGDAIALARGRSRQDFNRAAINRALEPIGEAGPGTAIGHQGVADAGDKLSAVYDQARTLAQGRARLDRPGISDIRTIMDDVSRMPAQQRQTWQSLLDTIGTDFTPGGRIADFKRVDSTIGSKAANFQGSGDAYQRDLGDAMGRLQEAIKGSVMRRAPDAGVLNANADAGWANLVRLEGAALGAKGTEGVFTPGQLLTAIRGADTSVRDRATARGQGLMQDLATSGQDVLGNKVPDSGTAGRFIPYAIMTGGGSIGMQSAPKTTAAILAGLTAGAIAYTPQVQRTLVRIVSQRGPGWQQAAQYLRTATEHSAPAAASYLDTP